MTDEELIARLREGCSCNIDSAPCMAEEECRDAFAAADRIEALVKERREDALELIAAHGQAHDAYEAQLKAEARAERLEAALEFYRNGFERKAKRSKTGVLLSVEYVPTNTLLEDCGNRAIDALKGDDHE